MARLKDNIEHLKHETDEADSDDKQRAELVNRQYEADKEKLHKIRLLLVGITLLPLIITVATLPFFERKSYIIEYRNSHIVLHHFFGHVA